MIRLDKRFDNNVSSNGKDNQQQNLKIGKFQRRGKDGERQNSSYPNIGKGG